MTDKGHRVLAGFVRLAEADRDAVSVAPREEATIMGPVHPGCPCCQPEADDE